MVTQNKNILKGGKSLNQFMLTKEKARKAKHDEFTYKGNTYQRKVCKNGFIVYKKQLPKHRR